MHKLLLFLLITVTFRVQALEDQELASGLGLEANSKNNPQVALAENQQRIAFLESQNREQKGQIEALEKQLAKLETKFHNLSEDNEFRFTDLEKKSVKFEEKLNLIASNQRQETSGLTKNESALTPHQPGNGVVNNDPSVQVGGSKKELSTASSIEKLKKYEVSFNDGNYASLQEIENIANSDQTSGNDRGFALYLLGRMYFAESKLKLAAENFYDAYKKYPTNPRAASSLFYIAKYLLIREKNDTACNILNKILQEYPRDKVISKQLVEQEKLKANCDLIE